MTRPKYTPLYARSTRDEHAREIAEIFDGWAAGLPEDEQIYLKMRLARMQHIRNLGEYGAKMLLVELLLYCGRMNKQKK